MDDVFTSIGRSLFLSLGMFWQIAWSLALGFTITSVVEIAVSKESIIKRFGKSGVKEIALATGFGAISSSCSYAAASMSRALFKKGASLISSLAFLFSSTNLVIELGIILWLLMGWQFAVAEWVGGIVLITIMALIVKLTYPKKLVDEARFNLQPKLVHGHCEHCGPEPGKNEHTEKMANPKINVGIARNYFMEWSMLWKDLFIGLLIAGAIGVFVPQSVFNILFLKDASPVTREIASAIIGPLLAMFTFVCSIGNVPLAAIFWSQGMGFSGVISFLYADLIVIPLLDVYRKYYGWKLMWYMLIVFFATMVTSGLIMSVLFHLIHLIPTPSHHVQMDMTSFGFNYTFYLNVIFALITLYFFVLVRKFPAQLAHKGHHHS